MALGSSVPSIAGGWGATKGMEDSKSHETRFQCPTDFDYLQHCVCSV